MKRISSIEEIQSLMPDTRMIECMRGEVNYYKFLCIHPHNPKYVILMNFCERPQRFYFEDIIARFRIDYTNRDIIMYRKDYLEKELKDIQEKLSALEK